MKNYTEMPHTCLAHLHDALHSMQTDPRIDSFESIVEILPCWDFGIIFVTNKGVRFKWHFDGHIEKMSSWRKEN